MQNPNEARQTAPTHAATHDVDAEPDRGGEARKEHLTLWCDARRAVTQMR